MEKEVVRNAANQDNSKALSYSLVLEKWREKVFEQLVATKRYELVIRDNLAAYNEEKSELKRQLVDATTQLKLANNKLATMGTDGQFKDQTIMRLDTIQASNKRELDHLREENQMMKRALKNVRMQT